MWDRPDISPLRACLAGQRWARLPARSARLACCWVSAETRSQKSPPRSWETGLLPFLGQAHLSPT